MIAGKMDERFKQRSAGFQESIPREELKQRREEMLVELRRKKREKFTLKRRALASGHSEFLDLKENINIQEIPTSLIAQYPEFSVLEISSKLSVIKEILESKEDTKLLADTLKVLSDLSMDIDLIDMIICMGFLPFLKSFLDYKFPSDPVYYAATCLCNLARGSIDSQIYLYNQGLISAFIRIISNRNYLCSAVAIYGIANLGVSSIIKEFVLSSDVIEAIDQLLATNGSIELISSAAHFFYVYARDFARHHHAPIMIRVLQRLTHISSVTKIVLSIIYELAVDFPQFLIENAFDSYVIDVLNTSSKIKELLIALDVLGEMCEHGYSSQILSIDLLVCLKKLTNTRYSKLVRNTYEFLERTIRYNGIENLNRSGIVSHAIQGIYDVFTLAYSVKFLRSLVVCMDTSEILELLNCGIIEALAEGILSRDLAICMDVMHVMHAIVRELTQAKENSYFFSFNIDSVDTMLRNQWVDALEDQACSKNIEVCELADNILGLGFNNY